MRALALLLLVLAGCSAPSALHTTTSSSSQEATPTPPPALLDLNRTFHNPAVPPPPLLSLNEWTVANLTLPADGPVTLAFTRHHHSAEAFAANCRLYAGRTLVADTAFSDAAHGNLDSRGTCTLTADLEAGTPYRATYVADQQDPTGTHEVRLRVAATAK